MFTLWRLGHGLGGRLQGLDGVEHHEDHLMDDIDQLVLGGLEQLVVEILENLVKHEEQIVEFVVWHLLYISRFILPLQSEDQKKLEKFILDFSNQIFASGVTLSKTYSPSVIFKDRLMLYVFKNVKLKAKT